MARNQKKGSGAAFLIYASNEPKSVLARDLGERVSHSLQEASLNFPANQKAFRAERFLMPVHKREA